MAANTNNDLITSFDLHRHQWGRWSLPGLFCLFQGLLTPSVSDNSAMVLAIMFSLKTMEPLQIVFNDSSNASIIAVVTGPLGPVSTVRHRLRLPLHCMEVVTDVNELLGPIYTENQ